MTFISSAGRWMRIPSRVAIGLCLAVGALSAQQSAATWTTVTPGQRVRITTLGAPAPTRQAGRVLSVLGDTIVMQPDGGAQSVAFPRTAITDMELSRGQHRATTAGIIIGVLGGGAAGVILVAATTSDPKPCPYDPTGPVGAIACGYSGDYGSFGNVRSLGPDNGQIELAVGVLGAIVGGAVGALIGHAHQSEAWEPTAFREKISVTPIITPGRIHAAGIRFALEWN